MIDQPNATDRILRFVLWSSVAVLTVIGIAAAIGRTVSVASGGLALDQIRRLLPAERVREVYQFDRWFLAHPLLTYLHVVIGGVFLAIAPFQFSSRIRSRHLQFHRWSGRLLVAVAVPMAISGLALGSLFPFGGPIATSAVFGAGIFFLFALIRAVIAIRRRDIAHHREWMMRMFAVALGIATVRVVGLVLTAVTGESFQELAGISFWSGWVLTLGTAELWIRRTRKKVSSFEFRVQADRKTSPIMVSLQPSPKKLETRNPKLETVFIDAGE
jgi:uncharacterized membrane protein